MSSVDKPGIVQRLERQAHAPPRSARPVYGFALASAVAVGSGCFLARFAGVPPGVWARNAVAWVIGAALLPWVARLSPAALLRAVQLLAPAALLASLFGAGQSGVHRWIQVGPMNWHVAFVFLPAAVVAVTATARGGSQRAWLAAVVIQLVLCAQPDASQAAAFAAAALVALLAVKSPAYIRFVAIPFFALTAAFAWTRFDPLDPVPEVEGIITLAAAHSQGLAALCIASMAAATAAPLCVGHHTRSHNFLPAVALFVYFLTCSLVPVAGAFPVPLVGMGMSPIVGYWLGVAALSAAWASAQEHEAPEL